MTELVALLSTGKGTWVDVAKLINSHMWDKVIIITNDFGSQNFTKKANMEILVVNSELPLLELTEKMKNGLKNILIGPEVAFNITSGSGKEHMALLSALLKLGLGIRIVGFENKIVEL
jgi:hypothetical protein